MPALTLIGLVCLAASIGGAVWCGALWLQGKKQFAVPTLIAVVFILGSAVLAVAPFVQVISKLSAGGG